MPNNKRTEVKFGKMTIAAGEQWTVNNKPVIKSGGIPVMVGKAEWGKPVEVDFPIAKHSSSEWSRLAEQAESEHRLGDAVYYFQCAAKAANGTGRASRALNNALRVERLLDDRNESFATVDE